MPKWRRIATPPHHPRILTGANPDAVPRRDRLINPARRDPARPKLARQISERQETVGNCAPWKNKTAKTPVQTTPKSFAEMFADARERVAYHVEGVILEFTEEVCRLQKTSNLSNSALARKLGVSPAFVTKLLGGENNFTIETMVKVARALDCSLRLCLEPAGMKTEWLHFLKDKPRSVCLASPAPRWDQREFQLVRRQETISRTHEKLALAA